MPGICFWVFPCFSYRWLGSCLTMPDIHFGFLSRWYESGQNRWVGHGEWQKPNLDCCKQGEAFQKKKKISQDHHAAEPLGTVGTQKLQEQGAISNRIPSLLLTYSLSLEPALFCESKYGWGQPCILCLIFYFIAASEEFIQTLALSLKHLCSLPVPVSRPAMSHKNIVVSEKNDRYRVMVLKERH